MPDKQATLDDILRSVNRLIGAANAVMERGLTTASLRELSIAQSNIGYVCRGKRETAGGYKWVFVDGK